MLSLNCPEFDRLHRQYRQFEEHSLGKYDPFELRLLKFAYGFAIWPPLRYTVHFKA
jgi:hypothetical protein